MDAVLTTPSRPTCVRCLGGHGLVHSLPCRLTAGAPLPKVRINAMNEKTIDQIEEEVLSYEVSDEAVEAAGTRTEIAGAWTFICTGIQCNHTVPMCRTEGG